MGTGVRAGALFPPNLPQASLTFEQQRLAKRKEEGRKMGAEI